MQSILDHFEWFVALFGAKIPRKVCIATTRGELQMLAASVSQNSPLWTISATPILTQGASLGRHLPVPEGKIWPTQVIRVGRGNFPSSGRYISCRRPYPEARPRPRAAGARGCI